ncbi:hypothetical protein R6Z07F_012564 [Ovis aries]
MATSPVSAAFPPSLCAWRRFLPLCPRFVVDPTPSARIRVPSADTGIFPHCWLCLRRSPAPSGRGALRECHVAALGERCPRGEPRLRPRSLTL